MTQTLYDFAGWVPGVTLRLGATSRARTKDGKTGSAEKLRTRTGQGEAAPWVPSSSGRDEVCLHTWSQGHN